MLSALGLSSSLQDKLYNELGLVSVSKPNFSVLSISLWPEQPDNSSQPIAVGTVYDFLADLDMCAAASRIAQAVPTLTLLKLESIAQKSYWVRQEERLVPLFPSPTRSKAFEHLSSELLAPLREGEFR